MDHDGTKMGYATEVYRRLSQIVGIPIIASGGAGCMQDFVTLFNEIPKVDAGLAASIFHFGEVDISHLKQTLRAADINVRI